MNMYICDGSHKGNMLGAGVVKVSNKKVNTFHFHYDLSIENDFNCHEIFAIHKSLELIQLYNDKEAVVYNDDKSLIEVLQKAQKKTSKEKYLVRCSLLLKKLDELKSKGFHVQIKHIKHLSNKEYHSMSHSLSREYIKYGESELSTPTISLPEPKKSKQKEVKKTISIPEFLAQKGMDVSTIIKKKSAPVSVFKEKKTEMVCSKATNSKKKQSFLDYTFFSFDEVFKTNKTKLKEIYPATSFESNTLLVSMDELKEINEFVFQRLSNRYWAVFSKDETLLYASNDNFFNVSIAFLTFLQKVDMNYFSLNNHYFSCLKGSYLGLKGMSVTDAERLAGETSFQQLNTLLQSFQISMFDDFYFAC